MKLCKNGNGTLSNSEIQNNFENVKEFTYFGSSVNNDNRVENGIQKRMSGNRTYFSFLHLFRFKKNVVQKNKNEVVQDWHSSYGDIWSRNMDKSSRTKSYSLF